MQKALLRMNIQLSQALSDAMDATGQRIIRAIIAGERDPQQLAPLRNARGKKERDASARACASLCLVCHGKVRRHRKRQRVPIAVPLRNRLGLTGHRLHACGARRSIQVRKRWDRRRCSQTMPDEKGGAYGVAMRTILLAW